MHKLISHNQHVRYVVPAKEEGGTKSTVDGVIIEVMSQATPTTPGVARIDFTPRKKDKHGAFEKDEMGHHVPADPEKPIGHHTAVARYSEGKEENTFHFPEPKAAPVKPAALPAGTNA